MTGTTRPDIKYVENGARSGASVAVEIKLSSIRTGWGRVEDDGGCGADDDDDDGGAEIIYNFFPSR